MCLNEYETANTWQITNSQILPTGCKSIRHLHALNLYFCVVPYSLCKARDEANFCQGSLLSDSLTLFYPPLPCRCTSPTVHWWYVHSPHVWRSIAYGAAAAVALQARTAHSVGSLQSPYSVKVGTAVRCTCGVHVNPLDLHSCLGAHVPACRSNSSGLSANLCSSSRPRINHLVAVPRKTLSPYMQQGCQSSFASWQVYYRSGKSFYPKLALHKHFQSLGLVKEVLFTSRLSQIHQLTSFPLSLSLTRFYSRLLQHAEQRKPAKQIKVKTLLLIDENGSNLGVMDRETALQLAESKGARIVQVQKETIDSKAVFKLFLRKQLWEEEQRKKKLQKKDPRNVTKEVTISVEIAEHDLAVKLKHVREFLEKKHSVRVYIQTRVRRAEQRSAERMKQLRILDEVSKRLEDVAIKSGEQNFLRNRVVCMFRPL